MALSSPRLRRLDEALAALAPDCDTMLLSELDGFLAGVILCPDPIAPEEWLPIVWSGEGDAAPFTDEREAEWYAAQVDGHRDAIERALAKGGGYTPFFEIDRRNGEVMWEMWIEGFAEALSLWPEAALPIAEDDNAAAAAQAGMVTLVEIARDESDLPRETIEQLTEEAPGLIPRWIAALYAARQPQRVLTHADMPGPAGPAKAGRNDPCPCGSGHKYKKCCGG